MCGIFGGFSLFGEKLDVNSIIRATNSLIHRGPDDFGLKNSRMSLLAIEDYQLLILIQMLQNNLLHIKIHYLLTMV